MGTIIRTTGEQVAVAPRDGRYFTLAELYEHTGCDMVQEVTLADGRLMYGDEEAYFREPLPPTNERASALYAEAGGTPGWLVLGDVIVCERGEIEL